MEDARQQQNVQQSTGSIHSSAKRLQQELLDMVANPPPLCSAGPKRDNDLYEWTATIMGPPESVYEGGLFTLKLRFTKEYPFRSPNVTFVTKIYHCNVDNDGSVCLDILEENWTPALTVSTLLVSICSLMTDSNPKSPLRPDIAALYEQNRAEHDRLAREFTKKHAFPEAKT